MLRAMWLRIGELCCLARVLGRLGREKMPHKEGAYERSEGANSWSI
jgi:hypothetical protein